MSWAVQSPQISLVLAAQIHTFFLLNFGSFSSMLILSLSNFHCHLNLSLSLFFLNILVPIFFNFSLPFVLHLFTHSCGPKYQLQDVVSQ